MSLSDPPGAAAGDPTAQVVRRLADLERDVHNLYEQVPFGSHCTDQNGFFLTLNATELNWLGLPREALIGQRRPAEFLTADSRDRLQAHHQQYGEHGYTGLELELLGPEGQIRPVTMTTMPVHPAKGPGPVHRVVLFDQTEYKERLERQRIAAIAFEAAAGICITDAQGVIVQVNQAFTELTGYPADELRGQTMKLLHSGRHEEAFYAAMWQALRQHNHWQGEVRDRRKNGAEFVGWLSISAIENPAGEVSHYVGSLYDITVTKARQEEISLLAFFDSLTQLPNRKLLQDRLSQALTSLTRTRLHGALLFIDMDNFKTLNDTRGHAAGDQLLIEVGRRLLASVRDGDSVARIGGDEFVVLLSDLSKDVSEAASQAHHVGQKILASLARPYLFTGYQFTCTASVGVSLFEGSESSTELLKQADLAMYEAKKTGRNTLCFFNPTMQASIHRRANTEQALALAIERAELVLHYQPQFDARLQIVGAEALLRWNHPEQGLLYPASFLQVAEDSGLIEPIGRWVLETACEQLRAWSAQPHLQGLKLSVNVSARQFAKPDFVSHISEALQRTGAHPARLMLELTETTVHDVHNIRLKMQALRGLDIDFSMDDFGNGYSSLARLIELPIHQLKIDLGFVQGMQHNQAAKVVVETVIGMAHSLGMQAIAEGVETQWQMDYLRGAGCPLFQGFLLSPAVPAAEFEALVERMNAPPHLNALPPAPTPPRR